jgi:hypothetical protein
MWGVGRASHEPAKMIEVCVEGEDMNYGGLNKKLQMNESDIHNSCGLIR